MNGKEMWEAFVRAHPEAVDEPFEVWAYGSAPDELAHLTVSGIKTATASAYDLYRAENEPLPAAGGYSVIIKDDEAAVCVIRTTKVTVLPFRDVPADFAWKEGEGDRTLDYWRRVHKEFFTEELEQIGAPFSEDMKVVCEEFQVVFK